mmetsp:Transcript_25434/g.55225  ORF Transcript_25434/g.55225 Transcript_25434/m.55225 type:complete len:82 (+) Transcript_25434:2088-2333(+)
MSKAVGVTCGGEWERLLMLMTHTPRYSCTGGNRLDLPAVPVQSFVLHGDIVAMCRPHLVAQLMHGHTGYCTHAAVQVVHLS